jgi:hypothetical protein
MESTEPPVNSRSSSQQQDILQKRNWNFCLKFSATKMVSCKKVVAFHISPVWGISGVDSMGQLHQLLLIVRCQLLTWATFSVYPCHKLYAYSVPIIFWSVLIQLCSEIRPTPLRWTLLQKSTVVEIIKTFNYHVHNSPPLYRLSQMNPVHTLIPYLRDAY